MLPNFTWSWRADSGTTSVTVVMPVGQRLGIEHCERGTAAADAVTEKTAGPDRQDTRAEGVDLLVHGALRAGAQRDHRDHGADADDDAEHRQETAKQVGPNRLQGDRYHFTDEHQNPLSMNSSSALFVVIIVAVFLVHTG